MSSIDPTTIHPDELAAMLAAWAEGDYSTEAAVGLLTNAAGGIWLSLRQFLTTCVSAVDDGWSRHGAVPMAFIDWDAVPELIAAGVPVSSGELNILRAAASLAGRNVGSLVEVTASLDVDNLGQVLDALAHRAGWHERGVTRTVTGHQVPTSQRGDS